MPDAGDETGLSLGPGFHKKKWGFIHFYKHF